MKCADGRYKFPEPPEPDANIIVTGAYDNHVPAPPDISATNIASTGCSGFHYRFSSETEGHEAANLIDGDYGTNWVPEAPYDQQYVSFGWDSPQAVDRIRLFDRPEVGQCSRSMRIHFSDGTDYYVHGGILDNGGMREILFDTPKNITYMTFWFTRWEGAPGLSEIRVYTNSHTPPKVEDPDAGEFTCDFEGAALGALMETDGGPSEERNSINWSKADWGVMEESPGGNKCAFIDFQPMVSRSSPPSLTPLEHATRIFYLPKGKKLKSIDICTPPGPFNAPESYAKSWPSGFRVTVTQLGADNAVRLTDPDGQWHRNLQLTWPAGPPQSNVVIVTIYAMGSPSGYGVNTVAFDNIVYGD